MDTSPPKIAVAIVAALEREILPLVRGWRINYREHEGRPYKFFEGENAVVVCGGIGAQPAARAAQAAVELYGPDALVSAGFAGSLTPELQVGQTFIATRMIDAVSGKIYEAECGAESGEGTLLTVTAIAGREEKRRMGERFHARALDMEAAAVAEVAAKSHLSFMAVKAISDSLDEDLPPMQKYVHEDGSFAGGRFLLHVLLRPSRWPAILRLARNAREAANKLSEALRRLVDSRRVQGRIRHSANQSLNMAVITQAAKKKDAAQRAIPTHMRAAVYHGKNDVRLETVEVPAMGPDELLVRVHSCGICGTDLKKIATGSHSAPRIFGHEIAGEVAAVGRNVSNFKPGERVMAFHHIPCGKCFYCRHKVFAQCPTYKKVGLTAGYEPSGGGFAEYVRASDWIVRDGVVKIPNQVSYEQAAFIEPINTCMKAIETLHLEAGETVLVIGQGPIGLMLALLAQRKGAKVVGSDMFASRLALSKSFGIQHVINASKEDASQRAREMSEGRGADAVILAVAGNSMIQPAVDAARPGGRILLFAQTVHCQATFDPASVCVEEKTLLGSYSASADLQEESVNFVFGGEVDFTKLISHRFPLERAVEALELAAHPQPDSMKIVISPSVSMAAETTSK